MRIRSFAMFFTPFLAGLCWGQSSIPSINPVQAIVGARIEQAPGRVIEKGNVVMRDGIIIAVGEGAAVPKGAEVLDGTGLTVYAGFIDGYTTKGLKLPEVVRVPDEAPPYSDYTPAFMGTENRKGIRPELMAARYFQPAADVLKGWQTAGFTGAIVTPSGYIGGVAALMNLDGRSPTMSTLNPVIGEGFSFARVDGQGYPASLLGIIAQIRQALADSFSYEATSRAFGNGGPKAPGFDEGLQALAQHRRDWSLFDVGTAAQIDRVLMMSREFQLRPLIVGGVEGWRRIPELKGVPVVASLAFGPEPGTKPEQKAEPPNQGDDPGDVDMPEKTAEQKRLFGEAVANVKQLVDAGVLSGFTTNGTKSPSEFMDNLRVAVKAGLPREAALAGLTTGPAELAGMGTRLGTIEDGRIANLVVMSADFLDAKAKVKMLFVNGRRIDPSKAPVQPQQRIRFGGDEEKKGGVK